MTNGTIFVEFPIESKSSRVNKIIIILKTEIDDIKHV